MWQLKVTNTPPTQWFFDQQQSFSRHPLSSPSCFHSHPSLPPVPSLLLSVWLTPFISSILVVPSLYVYHSPSALYMLVHDGVWGNHIRLVRARWSRTYGASHAVHPICESSTRSCCTLHFHLVNLLRWQSDSFNLCYMMMAVWPWGVLMMMRRRCRDGSSRKHSDVTYDCLIHAGAEDCKILLWFN